MAKICMIQSSVATGIQLKDLLSGKEHHVQVFEGPHAFLDRADSLEAAPDVVLFELGYLSSSEAASFIAPIKERVRNAPVLLLVEPNGVVQAAESIRQGAFNYIQKPLHLANLQSLIEIALHSRAGNESQSMFQDYPTLEELEKRYMKAVLEKTRGRKERAAKILGINRRTLYRKEREYGWVTEDSGEGSEDNDDLGGNA